MRLDREYFLQQDVVALSKDLIGKILVTNIQGVTTSGIICETEAYAGITDKASHAFGGRKTKRTSTMYLNGGNAYVYLCYGIHKLFNIVTNKEGIPHAILIRGILPLSGLELILQRRNNPKSTKNLCIGPGKVSQGLGIELAHDALDLTLSNSIIQIHDQKIAFESSDINSGPRIGIDYAEEDALLPYRFYINPKLFSEVTATANIER
ncbi:MAG: DNA-3-methyladenine glycosylase [Flavobacteriales bacterium]|nr:DNA-3-methyladenine glycosylase [Flavobacteriales bacterium]